MHDSPRRLPPHRSLGTLEILVMSILTDGPLHGYGLVTALRERSGGALRVRPGNLYRVLDRLCAAGLLESTEPPATASRGAERTRGFALTRAGRERLVRETRTVARVLGSSADLREILRDGAEAAP